MVIAMPEQLAARLSVASLNTRGIAIRGSRLASRYTVIGTEFEAGRADVACFQEVFTYWHLRLLARRMPSFRHDRPLSHDLVVGRVCRISIRIRHIPNPRPEISGIDVGAKSPEIIGVLVEESQPVICRVLAA